MKKIWFIILAALLIVSIFATGCVAGPCHCYDAPIEDVAIWADESFPPKYFLYVVSGVFPCDDFSKYAVEPGGNTTILVYILNCTCDLRCPPDTPPHSYVEHTIPLGSDFVAGVNYTVKVNDVTETFVAQ